MSAGKYDNSMRGVLFTNDKGDNPKRPDYTGECEVGGVAYRISAWVAYTPTRLRFLSMKFELKSSPRPAPRDPPPIKPTVTVTGSMPFNDEIPF